MNDPWNSVTGRAELSIDPFSIQAEDVTPAPPAPPSSAAAPAAQTRTQTAVAPSHRPPIHRQEPSAPLADIEVAQAWANGTGPAPAMPTAPSPSATPPAVAPRPAQTTPPTPSMVEANVVSPAPQPTAPVQPVTQHPAPTPSADTPTEPKADETADEAVSGPHHRFYSPASFLMLQTVMSFGGLALAGLSAADGEYLPAAIGVFMAGFALFSFGWVDIEPGIVSQEKIGRKTVTHGNDVAGLELDFDKSRHTKWWYPTLVLHSGEEVPLKTLRSVSKAKTEQKARIIQAALNGADIFVSPEERAAGTSIGSASAPDPDVFTPLPGLEHHYNR